MDFFTVSTIGFKVLYVFFMTHYERREILHFNVTAHHHERWTRQQLREAFPWEANAKYLILDNDHSFSDAKFISTPQANGLHHRYEWQAVASLQNPAETCHPIRSKVYHFARPERTRSVSDFKIRHPEIMSHIVCDNIRGEYNGQSEKTYEEDS